MPETCLQLLKAGYKDISGKTARSIPLPSGILFEEHDGIVRLELTASGVTGNMQEDAGAFEAWSLGASPLVQGQRRASVGLPAERHNGCSVLSLRAISLPSGPLQGSFL